MKSVWEFAVREVDNWQGYTKRRDVYSLHRSKEGAEKARDEFSREYPNTAKYSTLEVVEVEVFD